MIRIRHSGNQPIEDTAYGNDCFDDWLLRIETITASDSVTDRVEYVWGKDISGSLDGAAGIGGLLYAKINGAIYVPQYDAYGNIISYCDAAGNIVASYTYDAFGKTIASSGALADVFAFRYSTKYFDRETGLYYYGMRYYSPALRRWLTRDPIEERDGGNLYSFLRNTPTYYVDKLGLYRWVAIYYSRPDQPAFKRAAETYKREVEHSRLFSRKCDYVILKGALTVEEFKKAWEEVDSLTRKEGCNVYVDYDVWTSRGMPNWGCPTFLS